LKVLTVSIGDSRSMTRISGLALMLVAIAAFYYSLPRKGKAAWFVGTQWEGYVVVIMLGALGVGLMLALSASA
jgi:hypothetical protein